MLQSLTHCPLTSCMIINRSPCRCNALPARPCHLVPFGVACSISVFAATKPSSKVFPQATKSRANRASSYIRRVMLSACSCRVGNRPGPLRPGVTASGVPSACTSHLQITGHVIKASHLKHSDRQLDELPGAQSKFATWPFACAYTQGCPHEHHVRLPHATCSCPGRPLI